jgi:hypothetical protein
MACMDGYIIKIFYEEAHIGELQLKPPSLFKNMKKYPK